MIVRVGMRVLVGLLYYVREEDVYEEYQQGFLYFPRREANEV